MTSTATYEPVYDAPVTVTDGLDHTTTFGYDAKGNVVSVTDARDKVTEFGYDAAGQLLTITDPTDKVVDYGYAAGDLVSVTDADGNTGKRFTDAVGRPIFAVDPNGQTAYAEYDDLNRLTLVRDALGGQVDYAYDETGNLLSLTDPKGSTDYVFDAMDRLTLRTDPLSHSDAYTAYDANGNLTRSTDRLGKITTYQYDALNRLTFVGFGTVGTPPSATYESNITYTYDAGDRLRTAVDSAAGTVTPGYDDLDRLTSETTPQGSVTYTYDDADRRATLTLAGEPAVTYGYAATDRLTSIAQGSASIGLTYDDTGRELSETLPNGLVATYTYDDASHLTSIAYALGQTSVGDLAYTYDAAGNRKSVGGSLARVRLPTALGSATYNAASRISSWDALSPTYDNAGRMTSDGTYSYTWNAREELTEVKQGATTVAVYAYDAFGRRTSKTVSGTTTDYSYDGANVIQEQDGSGNATANLLTGGLDRAFQRIDSAGSRYFLRDALGSTVALTDASGAVTTSYTYEPFGRTSATGATSANSFQFTGREQDGALYYYRARYLQPTFGRFLSEDPLGFRGGDSNLYLYVRGNPLRYTDPAGHEPHVAGLCLGAQGQVGLMGLASVCGLTDLHLQIRLGAGASTGIGASGGLEFIETNATSSSHISGFSGCGGLFAGDVFVLGRDICATKWNGRLYGTQSTFLGLGAEVSPELFLPAEGHAYGSLTFDVTDFLGRFIKW